jgi:hypothetical protein
MFSPEISMDSARLAQGTIVNWRDEYEARRIVPPYAPLWAKTGATSFNKADLLSGTRKFRKLLVGRVRG